ncbi:DUF2887 domain-containing protein [Nostoc favosum]|uniref:Rpn family recombination-promoting nuclease/putative transposase n=1 Tax=Nostoc favosum CHAB5714 TaxID=2780399 RepID=A0ABS8IKZ2_9NOSO|nr:Rpn family recombination-promoting nuclease/putative transposase [Nostoc favosum CHAB5714]
MREGLTVRLIETILIYKLPRLSQEEIGKMFELNDLRRSFYRHAGNKITNF